MREMLINVQGLTKTFPNGVRALDGVSLTVAAGEHLGVVGESGCGKTTLARVVMGLVQADAGTVAFEGKTLGDMCSRRSVFCQKVRMVFQDPFSSLDPRYSVRMILSEALHLEPRRSVGEDLTRMRKTLGFVQLPADILARYPHEFSGGERQRIAIARALMTSPKVLILDEAVSSLDVLVQRDILLMLEELSQRMDVTYVFISHNLRVVRRLAHQVAVMQEGRVVEQADCDTLFKAAVHPYTQGLLQAAFNYEVL
ncbi:MAG: ATP-binding cassette domain-containing protein [Candidatus Omnitrophota bacterium]